MKNHITIIGAGIVGLATAMKLLETKPGIQVTILEKENSVARHQTGNNSGVIHAGVYYKPGSLKAINCIHGYQKLIAFCDKEDINYELCGKLIVASKRDEIPRLETLFERSIQNGLTEVKKIKSEVISEFEPHATGLAALHVPYTGIVDYKELAVKYSEIVLERFGGNIHFNQKVKEIRKKKGSVEVITQDKSYASDFLINTAGLYCDQIALMTEESLDIRIIPFRGEYVELKETSNNLVRNLIYPVPDPKFPFLGVHFTRMIHGGIEAGPNAVWAFKKEGYSKSSFNLKEFQQSLFWPGFHKVMKQYWKMGIGEYWRSYNTDALVKALQKLVPEIQKNDLKKGGAGVRAQACDRHGGLVDDFLIKENPWAINVLNAPSPAATASLAIGEQIAKVALKRFY